MKILCQLIRRVGVRRGLVFSFDLLTIGLAFTGAFLLRFDFNLPADQWENWRKGLPWVYAIQTMVFISQGLYRGLWYFASIPDLVLIIRSAFLSMVVSASVFFMLFDRLYGWSRSVFLLDAVLLVSILGGGRFLYRFLREFANQSRRHDKNVLIVGAGRTGNLIARELDAKIVGFVDDNPTLRGFGIQGARVLGTLEQVPQFVDKYKPTEIIVAIPSLLGPKLKAIVKTAQAKAIPVRICPPIHDVLLGRVKMSQLREAQVEDLLRREVVKVDEVGLEGYFSGRRVLVTGAGGSIGSELCRQVLMLKPAQIILYERSEYNLYRFQQELRSAPTELKFVIGDVLDKRRLHAVFEEFEPEIVIHAAAYKHVPIMEENVYESVRNNGLGTYQVLQACAEFGVKKFILVSTDKAVRPTSVMGATKRMAELITYGMSQKHAIKTAAVRFGNVLDSEGSVLPLFRAQIEKGGPVTVTHPDITRYFMTIPEASQLVLQASILGQGGEVFLLDMGEPVLIRELAEELIRLSGFKPYDDIKIEFSGLRKGEKLYEELLFDLSQASKTSHPKILVSTVEHSLALPRNWEEDLQSFVKRADALTEAESLSWIKRWVPEFVSPNHRLSETSTETDAESESASDSETSVAGSSTKTPILH